jgi:hypothetical protein
MRLVLLVVGLLGCSAETVELQVDLRTDYAPGVEFDRVQTSVDDGEPFEAVALDERGAASEYLRGIRVAEIDGLSPGRHELRVALARSEDGTVVAARELVVRLDASTTVTVTLARSCEAVECPGPGDDPSATVCVAGRCQPPECDGGPCGELDCTVDTDCDGSGLAECASPRCEDGVCLTFRDDSACGPGEFCAPVDGCRPAEATDGGVGDAGVPEDESCNAMDDDLDGAIDETGCEPCEVATEGGSTYLRCAGPVIWTNARDQCRSWGYELVAIGDATEDALIDSFIVDDDVWTSLNDRETEAEFVWAGWGPLDTYTDWDPETMEPNGTFFGDQDCVRVEGDTLRWRDTPCDQRHAFVCEAE